MKKILSIVLALTLLLMSASVTVTANSKPVVEMESKEVQTGDTVELKLNISNNSGISGLVVSVNFDKTALSLVQVKKGNLFSGFTSGKNYVWDESENVVTDGTLATFVFSVADGAVAADYNIDIIVRNCVDVDLNDVPCDVVSGTLSVKEKPVAVSNVTLNKNTLSLKTGEIETLIATVLPDNATNKAVTWKSSDNSVATVSDTGKVTAIKEGTATITVTTQDGSYSASCTVSVACSHTNKSEEPSKSPDCVNPGNNLYYTCTACGDVFKADGITQTTVDAETIPATGHNYNDADCTTPKTCGTCGATDGNALGHSFTNYISNNDATCTADGTKTAKCDRCTETNTVADVGSAKGHDFADATCTAPKTCTVCNATEGTALGHSFNTAWSKGEDGHWHECGTCGDKIDQAAHNFGSAGDTCLTCAYERAHIHRLSLVPAQSANCTDSGNKAYYTCSGCENWFEDASGAVLIADKSTVVINALGHDYADATCTTPKTCKVCTATDGTALGHSFTDYISNNDATCTEDGTKTAKCDRCDEMDTVADVGSAKGHNYAAATCTLPKTCKVCNATEGTALGHSYTNYISNNDATCTQDGTKTAKCDRCTETDTVADVGSAKGHDYSDATCTAPKTCTVCNATEGSALGHSFTNYTSNNDATCIQDGTKTAKCDRCAETDTVADVGSAKGHSYADATCTAPKTCKVCNATEGTALGHSFNTAWSKGEDGHWHECGTCGDKIDQAVHNFGSAGDTCLTCAYERAHVHRLSLVPAQSANCADSGNKAYYTCSGCENWFEDASGAVLIADKSTVVINALGHDYADATCTTPKTCKVCTATDGTALGHSFTNYISNNNVTCTQDGTKTAKCDRCAETDTITDVGSAKGHDYADATCTAPKTCKVCNATEGSALGHSYSTVWSKGEEGHWHECAVCGDQIDQAEHDFGAEGDKCTICEYERSHMHRLTPVPGADATCTENGSNAYYTCSGCEDWFEDALGTVLIADKSAVVVPAQGHDFAAATCTTVKTCKSCGATEGALLDHSDTNSDGKCDMCEKTMTPTAQPDPNNPQTGDDSNVFVWLMLMLVSIGAIAVCLVGSKKRLFR